MNIKDLFSSSAISTQDGIRFIAGKFGTIQSDTNGWVCSVNSQKKELSTTRRRKIRDSLIDLGVEIKEDEDAPELLFFIKDDMVEQVAELIQVKKKRKMSDEQKQKLAERLKEYKANDLC